MRTEIDGSRPCDAEGCKKGVVAECGCSRCDGEPLSSERFHCCTEHRAEANEEHRKLRGYKAEWWQGTVLPAEVAGTWNANGTWTCRCHRFKYSATPVEKPKSYIACLRCYTVRPAMNPLLTCTQERECVDGQHGAQCPAYETPCSGCGAVPPAECAETCGEEFHERGPGEEPVAAKPERWLRIRCVKEGEGTHSAFDIRYPIMMETFEKLTVFYKCDCGAEMVALPGAEEQR